MRTRFIFSMEKPLPSSHWLTRLRSSSPMPGCSTSTRLEVPPEIRKRRSLSGGSWDRKSISALPASRLPESGSGWPPSIVINLRASSAGRSRCPGLEITSPSSRVPPRASIAPCAIAPAALPSATSEQFCPIGCCARYPATAVRPSTAATPALNIRSSSLRASRIVFISPRPGPAVEQFQPVAGSIRTWGDGENRTTAETAKGKRKVFRFRERCCPAAG